MDNLIKESNICDILGCNDEITAGVNWGKLYLMLCSDHHIKAFKKKRRPPVKDYAILRESKRDKKTGILNQ
jgi:hypothetical protein